MFFFFPLINFAEFTAGIRCQKREGTNMAINIEIYEQRKYLHINLALSLGRVYAGRANTLWIELLVTIAQ